MKKNKCYVVTINWNSIDDVEGLIRSLINSKDVDIELIIVNNSGENLDRLIKLEKIEILKIKILEPGYNCGYTGGNNFAFEYIIKNGVYNHTLIINPDVRVLENSIFELINEMNADIGIVTPRTMNKNGKIIYDKVFLRGMLTKYAINSVIGNYEQDYAAGSCLLINSEIIKNKFLYDEDYFMYWEDVEYSLRIREAGYKIIGTNRSVVLRGSNPVERSINAIYFSFLNSYRIKNRYKYNLLEHCIYLFILCMHSLKLTIVNKDINYIKSIYKALFKAIYLKSLA